jgi:acetyltransferase-like isoleucine patch superfamily enzyme
LPTHVTVARTLKSLIPSGLRQLWREHRWVKQHGLVDVGRTTPRWISPSTTFGRNCRINGSVHIVDSSFGDWSYVETDARVTSAVIGKFTAIGPRAQVGLLGHPVADNASLHPAFYLHRPRFGYDLVPRDLHDDALPTTLGNDVWIGSAALIRDGITVGDGAVIGAGSVVTRDVPPFAVAAGTPARVLRFRFDEDTIAFLQALRWWDRSDAWLQEHAELMGDVHRLRQVVEHGAAAGA